ncbi:MULTISPECIES: DUF2231 domain-containing protein [unclassified Exiguobacterium]|uniref:DUF2231 domain-containing protein n=1 Tax=unclassified Exiguobacterium TaxID=2644629 RepID=UPI001BE91C29|nr:MULTISPECIES: DUF2231 domain-containing protein [unclassified Exiguobacterium]
MLGGVPLHPLLVHAPIGLLLFGTLLILISFKWTSFRLFALVTLVAGLISGGVAFLSGDSAEEYAEANLPSVTEAMVENHEHFALYSLIAFGITVVLLAVGYRAKGKLWITLSFVIALVGAGLLAYAGHLGGQMVYAQ